MNSKQLNIMNNLEQNYKKILEVLLDLLGNKSQPYQRKNLKIFDLEGLSLALIAENISFSSECQFLDRFVNPLSARLKRSVFGCTKK